MSENLVLCKDCVHSFRTISELHIWGTGHEYRCKRAYKQSKNDINLVIGHVLKPAHYERCAIERIAYHSDSSKENHCGSDGSRWEPKHKKDYFIWMKRIGNV